MPEERWEHRYSTVARVFDRLGYRPGAAIALDGVAVTVTEAVPCALTGHRVPMRWDDEDQGEQLCALIGDEAVPDDQLESLAVRAALRAALANDLHELAEWFHLDGAQVYNPHPNGRRYDGEPFTAHIYIDRNPPPAQWDPAQRWAEITPAAARRAAEELCDRITVGGPTQGRFETANGQLTHIGTYPDRDTGEAREWLWSVEPFYDYRVPAGGNTAAALRARLIADMFDLAAQSAAHEAAEWLTLDGRIVFDPHPDRYTQRDRVRVRLEHHTSALCRPAAAVRASSRPITI